MSQQADQSLPKACGNWGDLKAAYRLLSNPRVDPQAIGQEHRRRTQQALGGYPVVLCVQDSTELDLTRKKAMRGRGKLGTGSTQGLLQHSALAVVPGELPADEAMAWEAPAGKLLGLLHQQWQQRTAPPEGETLRQLQGRRTDGDLWLETAQAVAALGPTPARLLQVTDRGGDIFRFLAGTRLLGQGFVVRAHYDRALDASTSPEGAAGSASKLRACLQAQPVAGTRQLKVHEQRTKKGVVRCAARSVRVSVRYRAVSLSPPGNDPRTADSAPLSCWAVLVEEVAPPAGQDPLAWLLLTSEPVGSAADAWRIVHYYRHRWMIEEWHRVLKEGCRVEEASFDDAADVQRLAAIKGILAVRLLQLRELAQEAGDEPAQLQQAVPATWRRVVAALGKVDSAALTPRQFWLAVARQGGYLGRRHDPRPGWKVLWRGWSDIQRMVQGVDLVEQQRCG